MKNVLISAISFFLATVAHGELVRQAYPGVRPTGMGNAFIALSNDNNAMWYNPAGLARVKGTHLNLIDTSVGVDSLDTLNRLNNALFGGDFTNLVRTDREYARLNFRPTITTPCFSISIFDHASGFFQMNELQTLTGSVDLYAFNDVGIATAFAIPMSPYLSVGATTRVFQRSGIDTHITTLELLAELGLPDASSLMTAAFSRIQKMAGAGLGIGVDLGAMATIPLPPGYPKWNIAAVMDDTLGTYFRPLGAIPAAKKVDPTFHFGTALEYELGKKNHQLNLALDIRNAFEKGLVFFKQFNLGIEYKLSAFTLRAGVSQGHPTAGFSIEFPPHTRLHFSTYASEFGQTLWANYQRWYLVQLVVGFNPN